MSIKRYNEKRHFDETPEPAGKVGAVHRGDLRFVIQKHAASHLHYDFRLELNGVLLSWAVPKGPSLNPEDKRLAMHVEDHPLDYRSFEGIIPEGNYGAGTVMVWDEGTYSASSALSRAESMKQLSEGYEKGKLTFVLNGKKLHGEWSLVRMHGNHKDNGKDNAWLLIKGQDEHVDRRHNVTKLDRSAVTDRSLEEIAQARDAEWQSNKPEKKITRKKPAARVKAKAAPRAPTRSIDFAKAALALGGKTASMPPIKSPQLATLVDAPFDRNGWIFEIKYDGYRAIAYHPAQRFGCLMSRNGLSFDRKFADICAALKSLPCPAILDGEIVVFDSEGHSSFSRLQQHEESPAELAYCVFDLLYIDGVDVRELPLLDRKQLLRQLIDGRDPRLQFSDHVETQGMDFFALARKNHLEGIIAKDGTAAYQTRRTRHWMKIKVEQRQEFLICGYTAPRRSRSDIGSLVLGYYERVDGKPTGRLRFAGHVGTGMDTKMRADLKHKLDRLQRKTTPFDVPPPTNERATWVKPELICEVRFTEKTADCQLRHPVFIAMRTDKQPQEIYWEVAEHIAARMRASDAKRHSKKKAAAKVPPTGSRAVSRSGDEEDGVSVAAGAVGTQKPAVAPTVIQAGRYKVPITHPERDFFPQLMLTKLDVVEYYRRVASVLLPYLKDRPFVLHQFPQGVGHDSVYQQLPEQLPGFVKTIEIRDETTGEYHRHLLCQNEATLVYLVELGCIEMRTWSARERKLAMPDWMIFDLDPIDASFDKVIEVAQAFHDIFEASRVPHYCKTSGKGCLHVALPLGGKYSNDVVCDMAGKIAQLVHHEMPTITTCERNGVQATGKVYLDHKQNGRGKTLVAPYSLRAVAHGSVSVPLRWDEVTTKVDPSQFTLHTIIERVRRVGDLWQGMLTESVDLGKIVKGNG